MKITKINISNRLQINIILKVNVNRCLLYYESEGYCSIKHEYNINNIIGHRNRIIKLGGYVFNEK